VNRFRGLLVPRLDWIKVLYSFGTLGLHRLLTKTLKFLKRFKISKIKKKNLKISVFIKFHKISKFSKNLKILKLLFFKVHNFKIFIEF
jgi:hypothetical protein